MKSTRIIQHGRRQAAVNAYKAIDSQLPTPETESTQMTKARHSVISCRRIMEALKAVGIYRQEEVVTDSKMEGSTHVETRIIKLTNGGNIEVTRKGPAEKPTEWDIWQLKVDPITSNLLKLAQEEIEQAIVA